MKSKKRENEIKKNIEKKRNEINLQSIKQNKSEERREYLKSKREKENFATVRR